MSVCPDCGAEPFAGGLCSCELSDALRQAVVRRVSSALASGLQGDERVSAQRWLVEQLATVSEDAGVLSSTKGER